MIGRCSWIYLLCLFFQAVQQAFCPDQFGGQNRQTDGNDNECGPGEKNQCQADKKYCKADNQADDSPALPVCVDQ